MTLVSSYKQWCLQPVNADLSQLKNLQKEIAYDEASMFLIKDQSNKSINDFLLQAANGIETIINSIDYIINNNEEVYQKAHNLVFQHLYKGLDLLCNSKIKDSVPRQYYIKQLEVINSSIQLCDKITRHLFSYKLTK